MPTIEERVAALEGRVVEQSHMLAAIRGDIAELGRRMDQRFAAMDQKMTTQFYWLLGVQATIWLTVAAALLAALFRP